MNFSTGTNHRGEPSMKLDKRKNEEKRKEENCPCELQSTNHIYIPIYYNNSHTPSAASTSYSLQLQG